MKATVFAGLSGGVDSGVAAALMKEGGYDVVGVFIKIWRPEFLECTWREDRLDAMRVAAALEIPFREVDFSEEYKMRVIDPMIEGYTRGETPNPDVVCNRAVKFGAFAEWARGQGARLVATGHYARIAERGGHLELLRGIDPGKDQSYFLHRLGQKDLARSVFPVGGMRKEEVRARARSLGLPVAEKPDSQGLCFVGDVSMPDFLRRYVATETGPVLDEAGREVGEHQGAALYTIGQRHGFTMREAREPHFVVAINVAENAVVVSSRREDAAVSEVALSDVSWVYRAPKDGARIEVEARLREAPVGATLKTEGAKVRILFDEPRLAAPGQSLVAYAGAVCLGGGVIMPPRGSAVHRNPRVPARAIQ